LDVGRLNRTRDFLAQFREEFGDHVVSRKPLAVLGFEEFLANHAARVDEEVSRPRHAIELTGRLSVQNLISANNFGIGIGKQGKIDFPAIREILQYGFAIVADARNLQSLFFESRLGVLQLDQLPLAVGSPICRTKEEQDRAMWSFQALQSLLMSKLVGQRKSRSLLTDRQSDSGQQLQGGDMYCIALKSAGDRDAVSQMPNGFVLRIKIENLPGRIVVEHKLPAGHFVRALRGFGEGLVRGATAVDNDARP
jgi:hypothetical protein